MGVLVCMGIMSNLITYPTTPSLHFWALAPYRITTLFLLSLLWHSACHIIADWESLPQCTFNVTYWDVVCPISSPEYGPLTCGLSSGWYLGSGDYIANCTSEADARAICSTWTGQQTGIRVCHLRFTFSSTSLSTTPQLQSRSIIIFVLWYCS
jgi:hypothetical protein